MELNKEFLYNVDVRFQDLGSGVIGCIVNQILILPDNWMPTHNTAAKCDIVVSKDQILFQGENLTIAFARLSSNFPMEGSKPINWKKRLAPYPLKTKPLPEVSKFSGLQEGHIIVFPTLFLSNGTLKVIRQIFSKGVNEDPNFFLVRIRDNHTFQTSHCILAFKEMGKVGLFTLPENRAVDDISHFVIRQIKPKTIILRPKFLPIEETVKFFEVPEKFKYKRLDIIK